MQSRKPLSGVKVLDLTRLLPGPVCTMHLADMGADVIKIEDTGAGDYAPEAMRAIINRNKRGMRLDLKHPEGVEAFMSLVATADIMVEGFRPGVATRLGIGYEAVARINPAIIYCSITGYGQDGPLRDQPGHDLNYCAMAGIADQIGYDAQRLAIANLQIGDLLGGTMMAAMSILAALYDAQRTGQGRQVDVAMADAVLANAILPLVTLATQGKSAEAGSDNLSGGLACYGMYRTADGRFLAVGALEKKFWENFCDVLERPDLRPLHRQGSPVAEAGVRASLEQIISRHPLSYWQEKFRNIDCCVTPVLKIEEALEEPHFQERGLVLKTQHPVYGPNVQVAFPVKMSQFDFTFDRHAPLPGEHTQQVLHEAGYPEDRIADLIAREIVLPAG